MTDNLVADINRSLRRLSAGLVLAGHYDAAREIAQIANEPDQAAATDEPADNEPSTGDLTRMPQKTATANPRIITLTVRRLRLMANKIEAGNESPSDADLLRAWAAELDPYHGGSANLDRVVTRKRLQSTSKRGRQRTKR